MLHLAHLINPVKMPVYSDLSYAQPVTFESMRIAKEKAADTIKVDLLTTQFPEDHEIIPDYFIKTPDLIRSAADLGQFSKPKKLPLIKDILDRLYESTDAEYLIYTNVDIALQPHFYLEVAQRIQSGLDAFIINRRRIPDTHRTIAELPLMYAQKGKSHPGFDCFVFHRSLYPKFRLAHVCVGIPFIGICLAQNVFCYAQNFHLYDKDFLTFHIGMEIFKKRDGEYFQFNRAEFWKAMHDIWPDLDSRKFPWGDRNVVYRIIRWGLHPCIPIRLVLKLEGRRYMPKMKK